MKIESSGKFSFLPNSSTPTGLPGKFFWGRLDQAQKFQKFWYRGGEISSIARTVINPAKALLFPNTDGIGTAMWVNLEDFIGPIDF